MSRAMAASQGPWVSSGGKGALLGDRCSGDPQGGHEAHLVGVSAGVLGGVGHERAEGEMAAEVSPDLLLDKVGGLGPQDGPGAALVGLELVEGELDLQPLHVGGGQFLG